MTDELNRLSSDRKNTDRDKSVSTGTNTDTGVMEQALEDDSPCEVTVEVLPDWLKPMDEDDDAAAAENDKIAKRNAKNKPEVVKVKRGRGRPPLPKNVRARLNKIKALKSASAVQKMSVNTVNTIKTKRRARKSPAAVPAPNQTPKPPTRRKRTVKSQISTPPRPQLVPTSPTGAISIFDPSDFSSPPRLTRVSPLIFEGTQIPGQSLHITNVSQNLSHAAPGINGTRLHLWQGSPLQISPPKIQNTFLNQTKMIGSQDFPHAVLNGKEKEKEEVMLLIRDCVGCGCQFPAESVGDALCRKCKPEKKKTSPPNILVRKVGQDKWEVGKTNAPKKLKPHTKFKKKIQKVFVPEVDEDDEDDDDDQLDGFKGPDSMTDLEFKKRKSRRMCQRCDACMRDTDCGVCDFCMDKPKYGGSNKKRQKCRLRQCQFQSKLSKRIREIHPPMRLNIKQKLKPGRTARKRRIRKKPWEDDDDDDNDDDDNDNKTEKVKKRRGKGTRRKAKTKWNYSFKEEEEEGAMFVEAVVDNVDDVEEESDSLIQNESVKMIEANQSQHSNGFSVTPTPQSQEMFFPVPDVPETSQMLSPVTERNNSSEPPNETGDSNRPLPPQISQNEILQIEMVRVGSPLSQFTDPANNTQSEQQEVQTEHTPVITHIYSLSLGTEMNLERDAGLMDLFTSLRHTLLPAHWVGVMARGPILQLLQCSKLSTMADTVVQIEKGFFFQISVQNQPLLLMHPVYSKHPTCLTNVGDVVSLLLDLEGMSVCQGHQSFNTPWEPSMCVRAALCDLLIPKDDEQCAKCARPEEV